MEQNESIDIRCDKEFVHFQQRNGIMLCGRHNFTARHFTNCEELVTCPICKVNMKKEK